MKILKNLPKKFDIMKIKEMENLVMSDYAKKVYNILCRKGFHQKVHQENFTKFNYGDMTPINDELLSVIPGGTVILAPEVYEAMRALGEATGESRKEFPFFLFGHEIDDNVVFFDEFFSQSSKREETSAHFSPAMVDYLSKKLMTGNLVVCHGHSHPPIGQFYHYFSLGDFGAYVKMTEENNVFRNKEAQLMGCMVDCDGEFKFVHYDMEQENFYRFAKVYRKDNENKLQSLKDDTSEKRR